MDRSIGLLLRLAEREGGDLRERYTALIALLRKHGETIQRYTQQAARIGELETELADSKVAERAEGLLEEWNLDRDVVALIEAHVEAVLRPSEFRAMIERATKDLVEEIAERKLTAQAKAVLKNMYRMSEEQAHLHLRTISRKTRRPLKEVARELIEARNSLWLSPL